MHIHPSSPNFASSLQSEESAAIKIQAGFRGYRVRKQLNNHQSRCSRKGYHFHRSYSHHRHQRQHRSMDSQTRTSTTAENHAVNVTQNFISIEERSAAKIQAGVRGFLVRKKQKIACDAATKIQAGFRGFKARKEAEKLKKQ